MRTKCSRTNPRDWRRASVSSASSRDYTHCHSTDHGTTLCSDCHYAVDSAVPLENSSVAKQKNAHFAQISTRASTICALRSHIMRFVRKMRSYGRIRARFDQTNPIVHAPATDRLIFANCRPNCYNLFSRTHFYKTLFMRGAVCVQNGSTAVIQALGGDRTLSMVGEYKKVFQRFLVGFFIDLCAVFYGFRRGFIWNSAGFYMNFSNGFFGFL